MRARLPLPFSFCCAFLATAQWVSADRAKISDFQTEGNISQEVMRHYSDPVNFPFLDEPIDETTMLCTESPTGPPPSEDLVVFKRENFDRDYTYPQSRSSSMFFVPEIPPPPPPTPPRRDRPPPPDTYVPEPGTLLLSGLGFAGLLSFSWRFGGKLGRES